MFGTTEEVIITDNGFNHQESRQGTGTWPSNIRHHIARKIIPPKVKIGRWRPVRRGDHKTWDENINEFRYALNTAVHESMHHTAAMICFGRELALPKVQRRSCPLRNGRKQLGKKSTAKGSKISRESLKSVEITFDLLLKDNPWNYNFRHCKKSGTILTRKKKNNKGKNYNT